MMYSEKFVVAVKHNGRVLREQGDTVFLPFGCEYSLTFKNLNSLRALVRVSVDGQDATKGTSLIVPANGSVDLERFLEVGQMDKGHRFKFIERTAKIEDGPRGIKAEDGLIRVEFEFEKMAAKVEDVYIKRHYYHDFLDRGRYPSYPFWCSTSTTYGDGAQLSATTGDVSYSSTASMGPVKLGSVKAASANVELNMVSSNAVNTAGITVPGAISEQKFQTGQWFPTDGQKHVMVLRLMGQVGETRVEAPVTVKTKTECPTCGTKNKFGTKFCRECGTGLTLL